MLVVRVSTIALVVASLALASPAGAAWRAEDIAGTAGALAPRTLALDRDGRALLVFEGFQQQLRPQKFTGVTARGEQGAWARPSDLAGVGWGQPRRSRAAAPGRCWSPRRGDRLVWAVGRTDGSFGALRRTSAPMPPRSTHSAGERAAILRRYLEVAGGARAHFPVDRRAPLSEFEAIAPQYPVFRVRSVP